jgi:hypothetical protein
VNGIFDLMFFVLGLHRSAVVPAIDDA